MMLKDRVAVVTGAGRGIGRGIALTLAREGCTVLVSDINEVDCLKVVSEIEAQGAKAIAVQCDVSSKVAVDQLMQTAAEKFGRLDILVNNAGIFPFISFSEMSENDWDKVIDTNLKSIFLCSQAAAKQMSSGGKIVNISSIAAFVGFAGLAHYCASKSGMVGLTRALALELAEKKINVNSVAPGAIDTPGASGSSEDVIKQTIAIIPWGRMGQPEDIAAATAFLASAGADYITGQTLVVDGGYTLR